MLAISSGTYAKLDKVYAGTPADCRSVLDNLIRIGFPFPRADIKEITRGRNRIGYYRPAGGTYINDKIYTIHYSQDGTASLFI